MITVQVSAWTDEQTHFAVRQNAGIQPAGLSPET